MSAYSETEERRLGVASRAARSFGLVELEGMLLALDVDHLCEVIACPPVLAPLPSSCAALCGSVSLRGLPIPVLDLALATGAGRSAARTAPAGAVVVMRSGGRLLGLRVDAVRGMVRRRDDELHPLIRSQPATSDLGTHAFELGDEVATLIDAARIAALPGVPMVTEPAAAAAHDEAGRRQSMLLFEVGGVPLAIDAMAVDATVPRTAVQASSLRRAPCLGVIAHHGQEVPVLDTLALLGLGCDAEAGETPVVVLRCAQGLIGLAIHRVLDIVPVARHELAALPPLQWSGPALLAGVLSGRQHLVIDADALRGDELVQSLAALSRTLPGPANRSAAAGDAGRRAAGRHAMLTYRLGVEMASPLHQVSEIVPLPPKTLPLAANAGGAASLFMHRGGAIPLLTLPGARGRAATALDPAEARVLIVDHDGRRLGFVVEALCAIEALSWEQPATEGPRRRPLPPLVEVGDGTGRRTLPRVDLFDAARRLRPAGAG